jgi:hypothetical protein
MSDAFVDVARRSGRAIMILIPVSVPLLPNTPEARCCVACNGASAGADKVVQ